MMMQRIEQIAQEAIAAIEVAVQRLIQALNAEREGLRDLLQMQQLTESSMVHYRLTEGRWAGQCRAAIVTRVYRGHDKVASMQIILDGQTDEAEQPLRWANSVSYDRQERGKWHWPLECGGGS